MTSNIFQFCVKGGPVVVHLFHLWEKPTVSSSKLKQMAPMYTESFGYKVTGQINITEPIPTIAPTCICH